MKISAEKRVRSMAGDDGGKVFDESYIDNVLRPLFAGYQGHFSSQLLRINFAHAVMLAEQEIITAEDAGQIVTGLIEVRDELEAEDIEYSGEFEDYFFLVEKKLAGKIGAETAGKLHTARSRNDINITMFRMNLKQKLLSLLEDLHALIATLVSRAEEESDTIFIAFTHGQPAQPITYGHYLSAAVEFLLRDADRLFAAYETIDSSPMGAAAIGTTGFDIDRERMAELLGFAAVQNNSYGCIADSDYLLELYSSARILFQNLGRFIENLDRFTAFETDILEVPGRFVQISSIMPNKRNPVPVEHLRSLAAITAGRCETAIAATQNTPYGDINDNEENLQLEGYRMFDSAGRVLDLLREFMAAVKVNEESVKKLISSSRAAMTELADSLVRKEDLSFRRAHELTSELVEELSDGRDVMAGRKRSLNALCPDLIYDIFSMLFQEKLGRDTGLGREEFAEILSAEHFVHVRDVRGGTSPEAVNEACAEYRVELEDFAGRLEKLRRSGEEAADRLQERVEYYSRN